MQTEVISVSDDLTIAEAIEMLRREEENLTQRHLLYLRGRCRVQAARRSSRA